MNDATDLKELAKDDSTLEAWDRLGWVWSALFAVSVGLSLYFALRGGDLTSRQIVIVWSLTGTMIVGHLLLVIYIRRNPTTFRANQPLMILYVAVLLASIVYLITIDPAFYFMLFTAYGQVFSVLQMRYAITFVLALTGAILYLQVSASGEPFSFTDPFVLMYAVGTIGGLVMAYWIYTIIGQSVARRELIEQLEATQGNLAEAERREGQLEERQRLAREIHDTLAQGFTSIVMHLEALEQSLPPDTSAAAQRHLDMARQTARDNLTAARRVVQDLRPELLEKEPLPTAIERLVANWSTETSIVGTAETSGAIVALHPQIEVTLLRATQEALNNIRKHAHASEATVTLTYFDALVMLDVQDNGVGLALTAAAEARQAANRQNGHSGGFGLKAMRERVEQLEGTVTIESAPGEGTTLVVAIPT